MKLFLCNPATDLQGLDQIPSRSVGYILRILGQNPTEDDIVEMVMKVIKQRNHIFPTVMWAVKPRHEKAKMVAYVICCVVMYVVHSKFCTLILQKTFYNTDVFSILMRLLQHW